MTMVKGRYIHFETFKNIHDLRIVFFYTYILGFYLYVKSHFYLSSYIMNYINFLTLDSPINTEHSNCSEV